MTPRRERETIRVAVAALGGKAALVTGGARGIGLAIARKLASAGCDVVVNYYGSHDLAESLCEEIRALGRRAVPVQADVSRPEAVEELFATIRGQLGRLDILVSNAASGVLRPALDLTPKHWRWCMDTNALALQLLAREAAPLMGEGGRIIALSSLGSSRALPGYAFVGASKAALESLVRALAVELGPRGIGVNSVSAGVVDTAALAAFPGREAMLAAFAEHAPMGPALSPGEVADAVYLLCLPEAQKITGQTLVVDGGFSIRA